MEIIQPKKIQRTARIGISGKKACRVAATKNPNNQNIIDKINENWFCNICCVKIS